MLHDDKGLLCLLEIACAIRVIVPTHRTLVAQHLSRQHERLEVLHNLHSSSRADTTMCVRQSSLVPGVCYPLPRAASVEGGP